MIRDDAIVRRVRSLLESSVDQEIIGLDVEQGKCFGFNATGSRVWANLEEPRSFRQLRDLLMADFDVDAEQCSTELNRFLRSVETRGLIVIDDAHS